MHAPLHTPTPTLRPPPLPHPHARPKAIALVSTWRYVTRVPLSRSPAAEAYLLALGALSSGCLAAYLAGRRWRARAAYTASLEVTAVALRLMLFGMPFGGVGWQQFRCAHASQAGWGPARLCCCTGGGGLGA